jgi:hypothetical protein
MTAEPAAANDTITIPAAEAEKMQADLAELGRHRQAAVDRELRAVAGRLGVDAALRAQREAEAARLEALDARIAEARAGYLGEKAAATLTALTAGVDWLAPEAGRDALEKLANRFEAVESADGSVAVREKGTLRPAAEAVPELLRSAEFSHYVRPPDAQPAWPMPGHGPHAAGGLVPAANPGQEAYAHYLAGFEAQRQAGYSPAIGIPGQPGCPPVAAARADSFYPSPPYLYPLPSRRR